ncbi:hypothetical protein HQ585_01085 [candidate division KSB1 bacterium]|nr:hypothetical protein [candidate division KSB1 bacterium]
MGRYNEIPIDKVKTYSIQKRQSKVDFKALAKPVTPDCSFDTFFDSLPEILSSKDLKELIGHIVQAKKNGKPILVMMGAHVIKTGLSPILIDLMELGLIQGVAMNGAGAIHDTELAYFGQTSEDVASTLKTGEFGMAKETGDLLNETISAALSNNLGFGEAMGQRILKDNPDHADLSMQAQAYKLEIPVTIHVAVGTDIVHQQPSANGSAIGETSLRDFRIFSDLVSQLHDGGVVLLFGSAVILPEVFLKALTVARNVHGSITNFYTASFDMIRHYRPDVNVVQRPTQDGGKGYQFVGQHELLIPLFAVGLKVAINKK